MKTFWLILLILITGSCIETDIVEDQIILIKITGAGEDNGNISGLVGDEVAITAEAITDQGVGFVPEALTWQSSRPDIAAVDENGNVNFLATGSAEITAEGFGVESNALKITVVGTKDEVAVIEIMGSKNRIAIDETLQLTGVPLNLNGNPVPGVAFTWSSQNTGIATVSSEGLVTGQADGMTVIEAQHEEITGTFAIMVGETTSRSGSFGGLSGYDVSGTVTLSEKEGGGLTLMLGSDFSSADGPGLFIYLTNTSNSTSGGYEVGALNKNSGADTYDIEDDISLDQYDYVLIHCKPFNVPFGNAQLSN